MTNLALTVNFHGQDLFIVEHNGQPYTPMKTIVENMGLDWASQFVKLKANEKRWGIVKITIPTLGNLQEAVCMPLRKLFGWLSTISPNKVKAELRDKIISYQNECDDVLWEHWTNHQSTPYALRDLPPKTLTSAMLRHIEKRINWLVKNQVGTTHASLGGQLKEQFNVHKRDQIPADKYREVCAFLDCEPDPKALQGELVEPEKLEYQPPAGMMLVSVEDFEVLQKLRTLPRKQESPRFTVDEFFALCNEMKQSPFVFLDKKPLLELKEMLNKVL